MIIHNCEEIFNPFIFLSFECIDEKKGLLVRIVFKTYFDHLFITNSTKTHLKG